MTVASGVTLTLDNDTVNGTTFTDTASGATIQIDDGTVLTLTGGATINGGVINDGTASGTGQPAVFGSIDVIGPSTISNAFLSDGGVTIASGATLMLSTDTVTGTIFIDGTSSTAQVESDDRPALNSSAIDDSFAGTIDISGAVTFQSGVAVNGGAMSIASGATLDIENPVTGIGATLNDVYVMNSGTIQVDGPGVGTTIISLLLDGGTTVTGGTLLIHVGFPINSIEGAVEIGTGGATFDNVTVKNNNLLKIDDGSTLSLDDNAIIINGNLTIGTLGALDVEQGPATLSEGTPDATLDGVTVSNGGNINVGMAGTSDPTLLLDNGTTVDNGTLSIGSSGTLEIGTGGATLNDVSVINNGIIEILGDTTQLQISGNVLLDGSGKVTLTDTAQNIIVSDGSAATLTNSNMITGAGTIGDDHLTLVNDGTIDATGTHLLTIDTGINTATNAGPEGSLWSVGSLTVANNIGGVLEASAGSTLQINDNVLNNGLIESGDASGTSTAVVNVAGNITGTGSIEIFNHATFEIGGSVSSGQTVTFEVSNGGSELILDDPHGFQGLIKGLVGVNSEAAGNYIDLKGFSYTPETKVVTASFSSATDITAVTITNGDSANNLTIDLVGDYNKFNFAFASDGAGGTLFSVAAANSGAVSIVAATAPSQTLGRLATGDTFAFSFAGVGHAKATDFHPLSDVFPSGNSIFANAQAISNATQDDGYGNTVLATYSHDTVILSDVLKAQLHTGDFHLA